MRRQGRRIAAVACAVLGMCGVARAQSAADGFNPGANDAVYDVAVQPDGKIVVVGAFTALGGGTGTVPRHRIGRINPDGSLDPSFDPGANSYVNAVAVQADGKIVVGGNFTGVGGGTGTTTRNRIARLNADGSVDETFNSGADSIVWDLALQPDGKILLGGFFTALGETGTTIRNHVGRLNADGSVDMSFNPGANNIVDAVAVQPNGQILIGGGFTGLGGETGTTTRNHIGRLNADGSLDPDFNPGANGAVKAFAVQPDGKIVVGGAFTGLGDGTGTTPRKYLGRLYADGSLEMSFNPTMANNAVYTVVVQPDGKILAGGSFTFSGSGLCDYLGRLHSDGSFDEGFAPGPRDSVQAVAVQADGKILLVGNFPAVGQGFFAHIRHGIARLYADGSVDVDLTAGANDAVFALALQADGQVLVGGAFTELTGAMGPTTRNHLGRLRADGEPDPSFDPDASGNVLAMAVQPDGKILVGGDFTMLGGVTRHHIGRLHADGSLDTSFNPGANGVVYAIVVQPDGQILLGGTFTGIGGGTGTTTRNRIARLDSKGALDISFDPGANGDVTTLTVQPDGKILAGGLFTMLGGGGTGTKARSHIGRLDSAGVVDLGFDPGANDTVWVVALEPDGQILVGGNFTGLGGGTGTTTRNWIGRLNADGLVDSFDPGANGSVRALAVQADGRIIVGGFFTGLGGGTGTTIRNRIGRLNADGSLDTFDPDAKDWVYALALQADGKILLGGAFPAIGSSIRNGIGRLMNTDVAIQRLSVTGGGSAVTWSRSGAGPEVGPVTFDSTTDGVTYTSLGTGTRTPTGWRLNGLSLPSYQNVVVRARGYYATGYVGGSGSIVESVRNAYIAFLPFADHVLTTGTSLIRAVHIIELRARIDALRMRHGLLPYEWMGVLLTIRTAHVTELRIALQHVYTAAGQPAVAFTDPTLVAGSTVVKAVHIKELRDAVIDLEGS